MIHQLMVNGCSYMAQYCAGEGQVDLAKRLGIEKAGSLAISGCNNSRIIRSTLKHSYTTDVPTLYVLGITFLSRWEVPFLKVSQGFEGRWINPQAQNAEPDDRMWSDQEIATFKELQFKAHALAEEDELEDLMYRLISMLHSLRTRGHQAVIYNQVDDKILEIILDSKFQLLRLDSSFVHGLSWLAVPWQQAQGADIIKYRLGLAPPMQYRHIAPFQHAWLNEYLTNYIQENKILT